MSNFARMPFTEIFERIKEELVRDKAGNTAMENKYKGAVQDVYLQDFPILLPEDYLRTSATITTKANYSTGTVTIAADAAGATGASTAWTSALTDDSLFKADDENGIYRVTYSSGTSLLFSLPSTWQDDAVAAGSSYELMFDRFALASDFSHMVEDDKENPEVVHWYNNGGPAWLIPEDNGEYTRDFIFQASTPGFYTVKWVSGAPYLYIRPCDDTGRVIYYDYIPNLTPLAEHAEGTATCTADATAVSAGTEFQDFLGTAGANLATEDYYFSFDGDGTGQERRWYKISACASDTALTLDSAYLGTTKTAQPYTISKISKYPAKFDTALMYGAALRIDPNAKDADRWSALYTAAVSGHRGVDGRRIHGQKGSYSRGY